MGSLSPLHQHLLYYRLVFLSNIIYKVFITRQRLYLVLMSRTVVVFHLSSFDLKYRQLRHGCIGLSADRSQLALVKCVCTGGLTDPEGKDFVCPLLSNVPPSFITLRGSRAVVQIRKYLTEVCSLGKPQIAISLHPDIAA